VNTGRLALEFETGNACVLKKLAGARGGDWLGAGDAAGPWKLAFLGPDGTAPEYAPADSHFVGAEMQEVSGNAEILLRWRVALGGGADAEVRVAVRTADGDCLSRWNLEVALPAGWQVLRADFPVLACLPCGGGASVAVPSGWGLEYPLVPGFDFEGHYPSCIAGMQFVAVCRGGDCLYVGTHDPAAWIKTFSVNAGRSSSRLCVSHPAPLDGNPVFRLPFDVVIGALSGGYLEAARVYREFTFTTPWGCAGNVADRAIPPWLLDTHLWLRPDGAPEANVEVTKRALDWFGPGVSCHWYRWHRIPYDTHYPDYFPPLEGFAEGVAELQRAGSRVMPYINGRLWDPASESWRNDGGAMWAARSRDGQCYTEVYGSKVPNNVVCPTAPVWHEKIADLVARLIGECGTDGVYIDQIGAARGVPCHGVGHSHPPGGGGFWHSAYRRLLATVRERMPADTILTTEENAECWIDQFDALLLVNTPTDGGTPIPLFPAVYSDRAVTFGFQYFPKDEPARSLPFRLKMARCFLWGSQLGWLQPGRLLAPEVQREAEFLRDLVRCRGHAARFVTGGRFVCPVSIRGDNPVLAGEASGAFGGSYHIETPTVLASAWLAAGGSPGILLVNMGDSDRTVAVELPVQECQVFADLTVSAQRWTSGGLAGASSVEGSSCRFTIAAGSAVVLDFGSN
jgi:hypothetical protein